MKKLALLVVVLTTLAGCVVAPLPPRGGPAYQHPGYDRDGDGVNNRYDRRPGNPYRY
jgi:hypothetical protein